MTTVNDILDYVKNSYGTEPDYPFEDINGTVLRQKNGKWYALIMKIGLNKLGLDTTEEKDIINLKCDPILTGNIRNGINIFPAYHMNKEHWISVIPEKTEKEELFGLIDISYDLTSTKAKKRK